MEQAACPASVGEKCNDCDPVCGAVATVVSAHDAAIPLTSSKFVRYLCGLRNCFAPLRELLRALENFAQRRKEYLKAQRRYERLTSGLQIDTLQAPPYDRRHNATEEFPCRY
ncbi:MAG: hypothetical protein QOI77_380 [Blastocatellia bacterium]|nr:hypothetical protein [Blastocatellia bacterium]